MDLKEDVTISVFYFDPIKSRIRTIIVHARDTIYLDTTSKQERRKYQIQFWKKLPGLRSLYP